MESTAIDKRPFTALEKPAWIKAGDVRGTEGIGIKDIKPPALRIAQSGSPEVKRSETAKYIQGLQEGYFWNSLTKEIYGDTTITVCIVKPLGHRHVEFAPFNEGGGVLDFNVSDDDPRTQFTTEKVDGKDVRKKPRATLFYDYLVYATVNGRLELMTMSLKSTQIKKAKDLNTLIKGAKMPSFALQFSATPVPESRGGYSWYGWRIEPAGFVPEDLYYDAEKMFEQFKDKEIVVDREGEVDAPDADDIPF